MSKTVTSYADLKPRSTEDFPEYVAEAAKLERVRNEIAADKAEYHALEEARANELANPANKAVNDYLSGKSIASGAMFDSQYENQRAALLQGINLKTLAEKEQRRRVDKAREKASKVICHELMKDWITLEKDLAKKCRELAKMGEEKRDLLVGMERGRIMLHGDLSCRATMNESLLWQLNWLADEIDKAV